jgi:prolyl oligopeptidase
MIRGLLARLTVAAPVALFYLMIGTGPSAAQQVAYPATPTVDTVDDYHGTLVPDPYRWLEDTDAPETRAWIAAQNRLTTGFLAGIPARERLRERLTELYDFTRYGVPFRRGDRYFFSRNDGLQNQAVLYWQANRDAEPQVLLDPNLLSEDGTVSLAGVSISDDGRFLAYATSSGGSDWREIFVRDIETGRDLDDHIEWMKFSGMSWTKDGRGFFYSRYPVPEGDALLAENVDQKLYYHRIGTEQSEDVLVHERPDEPRWGMNGVVTDDGQYLIIYLTAGTDRRNRLHYMDLQDPVNPRFDGEIVRLMDDLDASYAFVGNEGPVFYFNTDHGAPRGRLIAVDIRNPEPANWRTVIPEREETLRNVSMIGGRLLAGYLQDAHSRVHVHALDGTLQGSLDLPGIGSVGGFSGRPDDPELFYAFTSYLYPTTIFRHDLDKRETEVFRAPEIEFDASPYMTRQVFYESKDGTRVPMFITHRRDIELDGSHPTLLYAYGGFNISLTPSFSPTTLAWLEEGGIYAVANIRGGGEYGEDWHRAGMLHDRQNVFDDFIAAAEYLIEAGFTRPQRLAIAGGSNGGLLVGAVINQRPELFGAALPAVGVMDMLRFHRFTIGWAWVSEYGSSDDPEQFRTLFSYSPLHNIRAGVHYPAVMVTTADHDDRVVPGHSFKYAAALQAAQEGEAPVLIRVETRAGHGAGKPTWMVIEENADVYAFLLRSLGVE